MGKGGFGECDPAEGGLVEQCHLTTRESAHPCEKLLIWMGSIAPFAVMCPTRPPELWRGRDVVRYRVAQCSGDKRVQLEDSQ